MGKFEIKSVDDLLELPDIDKLSDDDLLEYGQAVCQFGDDFADQLSDDEKKTVLSNARYGQNEASLRLSRKKLAAITTAQKVPEPATPHKTTVAEALAWIFVALSAACCIVEYICGLGIMPLPFVIPLAACIVFGIAASITAGRL